MFKSIIAALGLAIAMTAAAPTASATKSITSADPCCVCKCCKTCTGPETCCCGGACCK